MGDECGRSEEGRSKSDLISYLLETTMSRWESGQPISEAVKNLRQAIKNENSAQTLAALDIHDLTSSNKNWLFVGDWIVQIYPQEEFTSLLSQSLTRKTDATQANIAVVAKML